MAMDNSVKNSIRNFFDMKSSLHKDISLLLDSPSTTNQLAIISKVMEEAVKKFTKRYLIISTELEEMKRDFLGEAGLITDFVTSTRKNEKSSISKSNEAPSIDQKQSHKKEDKSLIEAKSKKKDSTRGHNASKDNKARKGGKRLNSPESCPDPNSNRQNNRSESKMIKKEAIKNFIEKDKPKETHRDNSATNVHMPSSAKMFYQKDNKNAERINRLFKNNSSKESCRKPRYIPKQKVLKAISIAINSQ